MSLRDISRREKKYICLAIIAIVAFNFLFLPLTALAQSTQNQEQDSGWIGQIFGWITGKSLLFVSSTISMLIGAFFGAILYLEAIIIDYIISPSNFSLVDTPIVKIGWGITRDLANMFFILILLIISFATVLRIKSYAIGQLWWKVVVAALLINFSLVIAGFVIDFANILTAFFLNGITGGGSFGTVTTKLAASMQILNFYNPANPTGVLSGVMQFGASSIAAVVGILLSVIGMVVTVFVFGAAMIFLIVRILHIWLLLIFAPIVWMLWILPDTSSYFSKWWNSFLQWTFFAPIFVFMIYLSLQIFDKTGQFNPKVFGVFPAPWKEPLPGISQIGMPAAIFQWVLVIAMMFGSLIVAQKFGVEGANASQKMLKGWGNSAKNWAGRQLRSRALGVGAKEAAPGVEARPGLLVRGAQKLAAVPGGRLLAGQVFKMTAAEAGTVENAQKQFTNWTPEAIQSYLAKSPGRVTGALSQNQQIGAALALKERGKLDKLGEPRLRELASLASQRYPKQLDEILKVAPHLATEFNKNIKAAVAKIEKADEVMIDSLGYAQVVMNLNPQQLKTTVQKASDNKIKVLKKTVNLEFDALDSAVKTTIQNEILNEVKEVVEVDSEGRRTTKQITISKEMRNNALRKLAEQNPDAEKVARAKLITTSPAWNID